MPHAARASCLAPIHSAATATVPSDAWWHWQAMLMDTAWVRFARLSDEARQCLAPLSANLSAALDVGKHLVGF